MATDIKNDATLSTNLGECFEFQEESGNRTGSANSLVLTDTNSVLFGTGHVLANAADFEAGTSEYFKNTGGILRYKDNFSFSFWINFETLSTIRWLIHKRSQGGGSDDFSIYSIYWTPNVIALRTTNGSAGSNNDQTVAWTPSTATWYHVAITRASGGTIKFYIDGSQTGGDQTGYNGTLHDDVDGEFDVSFYRASEGRYFDGKMEQLCIWNKVLTSTEVTNLYNSGDGIPYEATGGGANSNFLMFM